MVNIISTKAMNLTEVTDGITKNDIENIIIIMESIRLTEAAIEGVTFLI